MIEVAIIGAGNIAVTHIKGYLNFKEKCKIVAVVDIFIEKAIRLKEEFNLDAKVYDSCEKLLENENFDLASICTPPYTHAELAIQVMKSKKDVLVEKPMASSLEECDEMIKVMEQTSSRMSIISQNRWLDHFYNLKRMVDTNKAGKIIHAQVDSFWWRSINYYDLWWRGTWEKEGGGCTLNHAVHHIDLLNWIKGKPKQITAIADNLNHDNCEVEDFSIVVSKYEDGSLSTLTSSLVHHGEEQKIILQCEKAKIASPWSVYASKGKSNGFYDKDEELTTELDNTYKEFESLKFTQHDAQILNVLEGIEKNQNFLVTPEDGRTTIEYITAVYKSNFEKSTVNLPIDKNDVWYTTKGILENIVKFHEKTVSLDNLEYNTLD